MTQSLIIVASIAAEPGQAETVKNALLQVGPPSRAEAGCLKYELHFDQRDPNRFVMLEEWTGQEALDAHMATPHFLQLAAAIGPVAKIDMQYLGKVA
jgi:quinol monooxygenase YgiN